MSQDSMDLVIALNLHILHVISQVARDDAADACLRFGMDEEMAKKIALLNGSEMLEMSRSPRFLFSINEDLIAAALQDVVVGFGYGYGRIHRSIVDIPGLTRKQGGQNG